jgi:L-histidine N-alpha-methyltransferase
MDLTEMLAPDTTDAAVVELLGERMSLAVHARSTATSTRDELIADVRRGLGAPRKWMPPRWFYDDRGCELFEAITELPEYYQTRTEAGILDAAATHIAALTRPATLVELGAGSCTKTRILLDAMVGEGLTRFVPVDVSEAALATAARGLTTDFASLHVHGVVADFSTALENLDVDDSQCILFLGSTIGNLLAHDRVELFDRVRSRLGSRGHFLLGVDMVKPVEELLAAYNDSAGVTAAFNRNLLGVLNRELDAEFDLDAFTHEAPYDVALARIEMHLRSVRDQWVDIPGAGMRVHFGAGESVLTEISAKFTRDGVSDELDQAGLRCVEWFSDAADQFSLVLATPR